MNEKVKDFLTELSALTQKYGIAIGGCGCCGSPWLYYTDESLNLNADDLKYDEKTKQYKILQ